MSLNVKSPAATCDDPIKPLKCTLPAASTFTLSVSVNNFPPGGYAGFQTQVFYGPLTYKPTAGASDEIVWPDSALPLRDPLSPTGGEGLVNHADASSPAPPFPASTYTGNIVQIALNCPPTTESLTVSLLAFHPVTNPFGTGFMAADRSIAPTSGTLDVNCVVPTPTPTKQPPPGDTDGDGCTDEEENGPDERLGGQRDYLNFWDFYDTPDASNVRDRSINLFGDIFGVAFRFGATGDPSGDPLAGPIPPAPAYHAAFDRGAQIGPNLWDLGPPDGTIDLFNDIFGVANQFGHSCQGPV